MTSDEKRALVVRYYDACSAGDVEALLATVTDDVVHYFLAPNPGSQPVAGADHLARYWRKAQALIDGRWTVDAIVAEGDEAVIEWTLFWTTSGGERVATRGAEWYRFRDGRIAEIRAYYQQRERTTELEGYDYAGRGYAELGREEHRV
ncbi:MAG TPA: nuclear transport factor 2 family protein [Gaiellaceae bacterium]|nr:nuclear transport factor 2 family protein [Gaiellaceae bacterium]